MSLYNKIRYIGVRKGQSSLLKVKLIVLNHLAIATFLIVCGYVYLHFQMEGHGWQLIAIDLFALLLAILILFLNSTGKYIWTFYMVSVGYPLIFIAESLQTGMQTEMEYLLFISGIGTTLLVEDGKTKWLFFGGNFISFILLKVFYLYCPMGFLEVKMSPAFLFINGITGFLLVYLIVNNAILNSFHLQQKLIALNDTLENKVEERTKEIEEKSKQLARSVLFPKSATTR